MYVAALRDRRSTNAENAMVGIILCAISGKENFALPLAMVMSHSAARAQPKPAARPWTTPTIGALQLRNAPYKSKIVSARLGTAYASCTGAGAPIAARPRQKSWPAPLNTTSRESVEAALYISVT